MSDRVVLLFIILTWMMGSLSFVVAEQRCDTSMPETTPTSRFKEIANGSVIDNENKRVWLRCPLGMHWNGSHCDGSSTAYSWRAAKTAVDELNISKVTGRSDWRLPTQAELQSIVEQRCYEPAANLDVFTFSAESGFWTATPVPGVNKRAMMVHFLHGGAYVANQNQSWQVRPVAGK